jgi:hypothetical protein
MGYLYEDTCICSFFVAFFSVTVDGRNLIFGHKLHIGTSYHGKRFWTHQIPTSCLPILLIFIHKTWGTYMKLVTKHQMSAINSCWEKCDEKCAYMFNVYKNQLSPQTGSRNLMGPKTPPTIWGTYMTLVTKYQISVINSCWEKCAFGPIRLLLPVCGLSWFLYTLNIYAHFSSHFSQQLLMAEIWCLVTSFI